MHSGDIEIALANHLGTNCNLIVPNISYGLGFHYELDLLVVTKSGYADEIEIKISKSDLKADAKKEHGHHSEKIKRLYFAVPKFMEEYALKNIPKRAGLFIINEKNGFIYVTCVKVADRNKTARKLNEKEINHLYELVALRMWSLKRALYSLQRRNKSENEAVKF
jgi:hypothetical protein